MFKLVIHKSCQQTNFALKYFKISSMHILIEKTLMTLRDLRHESISYFFPRPELQPPFNIKEIKSYCSSFHNFVRSFGISMDWKIQKKINPK